MKTKSTRGREENPQPAWNVPLDRVEEPSSYDLLQEARRIIVGFINTDINGVICAVPDGEDSQGLETPPHRYWCASCQSLWKRAYAFYAKVEAAKTHERWQWEHAVLRCDRCAQHCSIQEAWFRNIRQGLCQCGGGLAVAHVPFVEPPKR